ncbi:F-box/kelch-repeat protein At3g06240-like isoform X2 [Rutidosis leptorrhynchoides]|uniref:F-box/kelch-repeat protein At3g06240-like isoform X2 n=1 Tax=Rutidosis leptorrhynchoides TaxID=125765 RepID=UPI003A98F462
MYALFHLPPDLIEAILLVLPPKSLGRFKSVSKQWNSLISSPNFIKTLIQKFNKNNPNPDPTHLILHPNVRGINSLYSLDIKQLNNQTTPATLTAKPLNLQEPCYRILGSCNGLVLANDEHDNLYLVNPTTRNTLKVLVGNNRSWVRYGFGYDLSTDDYKVISISIPFKKTVSDRDPDTTFVRVYSLRNDSWRNFPNLPNQLHDYCSGQRPGVLFNSNLHFIVGGRRLRVAIAAFSLADEEFHILEFPDSVNNVDEMCSQLFALGEKLAVVICIKLNDSDYVDELWVMEEYGVSKSWTKLCIIENVIEFDYEFYAKVSSRDILLRSSDVGEISLYNMDERRITRVRVEGCHEDFFVDGRDDIIIAAHTVFCLYKFICWIHRYSGIQDQNINICSPKTYI